MTGAEAKKQDGFPAMTIVKVIAVLSHLIAVVYVMGAVRGGSLFALLRRSYGSQRG